ncbi:hypothetical protein COLO4_14929 [Corchorus olitorius]|uniref:F-box domain-containing protein n=1 Tax=Corchorus olitorius TaxID=93759 RepID=A0A1R3JQ65_9ROSI|nr:hypothetical protein COLO4_14929 [Corchorus olitorius]
MWWKNRNKKKNQQGQKQLDPNKNSAKVPITKNLDINEAKDDFISRLPDDIPYQIISFLPFESAIRTGSLSTRWENFWKDVFSARDGTIKDVDDAVFSFLNVFHELRRSKNNLEFQFSYGEGRIVSVVLDPNSHTLCLKFSDGKQEFPKAFGVGFCYVMPFLISDKALTSTLISIVMSLLYSVQSLTIDPSSYHASGAYWYPENVARTLNRENLKVVKLQGFENEEDEILLAMRLKEVFSAEPLIIAKSGRTCLRGLVPKKKNKHGELPYKFKRGVKNINEERNGRRASRGHASPPPSKSQVP